MIDYLIKQGISSQCLIAKGYGKSRPIADNNTEEGRQLNRRTEFKILKNKYNRLIYEKEFIVFIRIISNLNF